MPTSKNSTVQSAKEVEKAIRQKSNAEKKAFFPKFFRTGPGEYGEGDQFYGTVVPDQRAIAKDFQALELEEIKKLLDSPIHECRLTGLFILVRQFERTKVDASRKSIYDFYLRNIDRVNNWDLVDSSCHKIMGPWLLSRSRKPLHQFARARHLWKNRIAIVTTFYFIKREDLGTTLEISELLLDHPHDLIHKAVGWMLRELGKQNEDALLGFLRKHHKAMPRTMLRYSIEKFSKTRRKQILVGDV